MTDTRRCLTCGGPLELRRFIDALDVNMLPSLEDCSEGLFCSSCKLLWVAHIKDDPTEESYNIEDEDGYYQAKAVPA